METGNILISGFAATIVLTTIMAVSKPMGISRMDLPFLLGTMFTGNRNRAPFYGLLTHMIVGLAFAFIYAGVFTASDTNGWWFGLVTGLVHGLFVLSAGLQIVSAFHPRMAHAYQGPTPTKQLQPPGFFALNYGIGTPVVTLFAHMVYGSVLGFFYA
ncbi:MAG TPA: hypothetical protein VF145_08300 [Chitinophagaceae bacterium]